MTGNLILASTSGIRSSLLTQAGIPHQAVAPRVDEDMVKDALLAENASARTIADTLAEMKARKVAERTPKTLVLGCDQTLCVGPRLMSKPRSRQEVTEQLSHLQGQTHHLYSAIVLYEDTQPIWRHIAEARMTMRPLSDDFIAGYVSQHWPEIAHSVGGYQVEAAGISLFSAIDGEHSGILGLPLPPLISYLALRGFISS